MGSQKLIDEAPLLVLPSLAASIGLENAVVLQQLHWLLENHRDTAEIEGQRWIRRSTAEWEAQFRWASGKVLRRIFAELRERGLVLASGEHNASPTDRTLWYAIDYGAVDALPICPNGQMQDPQTGNSRDVPNGQMQDPQTGNSPYSKDLDSSEDSEDQGDRAPARAEPLDPEGKAREDFGAMKVAICRACLWRATTPEMDARVARAARHLINAAVTVARVEKAGRTWSRERERPQFRTPERLVEQACREVDHDWERFLEDGRFES